MRKITIDFSMTSLDSKASFKSNGELKENRVIFNDNEGNRHFIIMHGTSIEYHKRGSMNMKYTFSLDQTTSGTYKIENNEFCFDIQTLELVATMNQIFIKYHLLLDDEIINKS